MFMAFSPMACGLAPPLTAVAEAKAMSGEPVYVPTPAEHGNTDSIVPDDAADARSKVDQPLQTLDSSVLADFPQADAIANINITSRRHAENEGLSNLPISTEH